MLAEDAMSRPKPTAIRRLEGNPGNRGYNPLEPIPPDTLPNCPAHLNPEAKAEWQRLAQVLHDMGVLTVIDRAVLAAYCQCYGRWVEAPDVAEDQDRLRPAIAVAVDCQPPDGADGPLHG
jgi:Phage terminase, small subunit